MRHVSMLTVAILVLAAGADAQPWTSVARVVESPHPYPDAKVVEFPFESRGAVAIRAHIDRLDLEEDYDILEVVDGRGRVVERLTGSRRDFWTAEVRGSRLVLRLRADESMSFWGFRVDRFEVRSSSPEPAPEVPQPEPVPVPGRSVARIECIPAKITVPSGGEAALEIRGYDRRGRPVPPDAIDVFWNVFGEGAVLRTNRPGHFILRAPRVERETAIVIRATDGTRADVRAEAKVVVVPRPAVTTLAVLADAVEVGPGGTLGIRLEGRTADRQIASLAGWPARVWLEGPGRIEPMRGLGLYRYVAPADVRRPTRVVVHAALTENQRVAGSVVITARRPVRLVGLSVNPSKALLVPGEEIEIRVEGIGEPANRPPSMDGVDVSLSVEIAQETGRAREAVALGRQGATWRWRAPARLRGGRMEFVFRAVARNRRGITGEARVVVSSPITSLSIEPERDRCRAGDEVAVLVYGRTADSRDRIEIPAGRLRLRLDGPGRFEATGAGRFRYTAPSNVDRKTVVTLRAGLREGRARISGQAEITVRPVVRLKDVDVRADRVRVRPGETVEIRLSPVGENPAVPVAAEDVALALTSRGGSLRRVSDGVWAWTAPAKIAGRRAYRLLATARGDREVARALRIIVEQAAVPATTPIDDDDLIEIYEWKVQPLWPPSAKMSSMKLPKGDLYKSPSKDMSFKGRIHLTDVRSISVEITREKSDKVRTYGTDSDNLKLKKDDKRGWVFVLKKDFSHEKTKYTIRVLVTAADGAVYRDSFRVVRKN